MMAIEEEWKVCWDWGYKEGIEKSESIGFKKGCLEGHSERETIKLREIAKNFKLAGILTEVIAKNTGLTIEEVEKL